MIQRFFIPVKFPSLNDYIAAMNSNRHLGNAMKRDYTDSVALLTRSKGRLVKHPVTIDFIWYEENSKRDPDNIIFAKKFILDGLVEAGILPNDTQAWIFGFTDTWLAKPPKNIKIIILPELKIGVEVTIKEIL